MNIPTYLENIGNQIQNSWHKCGCKKLNCHNFKISCQHALNLQAVFLLNSSWIKVAAGLTEGLGERAFHLCLDARLPDLLPLNNKMDIICAFTQQITIFMIPLTLIIDIEKSQWLIRYSFLATKYNQSISQIFFDSIKHWMPLLKDSLTLLQQGNMNANKARLAATYLHESAGIQEIVS